jgi:hypothetical protein
MRSKTTFRWVVATAIAASALLSIPATTGPAAATIRPASQVASHWLGFGYNQDAQFRTPTKGPQLPWTDAAFSQMTTRADYIRPGMVRIMVNRSWFNPSGIVDGNHYTWTSQTMLNVFKVLDYYKSRGVSIQLGIWGVLPSSDADPYTAPDTATMQAALVSELVKVHGYTNLVKYNGVNEPNVGTDAKKYKYADWVTATANLRSAFATAGLSSSLIGGPDTAEAQISENDGDLGLESIQSMPTAGTTQTIVWNLAGLKSFAARFYLTDAQATDWSFQVSQAKSTWTTVATSHTTPTQTVSFDTWFRTDFSSVGALPAGTNYLKLVMPGHANVEREVSSLTATDTAGTFVDPMNDFSLTTSHTSGWTHPQGSLNNDWWLQAAQQRPAVAGIDTHFYDHEVADADRGVSDPKDYPEGVLANAVGQVRATAPEGTPIILGETGMKAPDNADGGENYGFTSEYEHGVRMADLAVQEARIGLDGAMAWCLDGYDQNLTATPKVDVQCGMWDHYGTPGTASSALRPWFYTWSLLCRYLPAGSVMYAPADNLADVRELDVKLPASAGGGWTFVLVNRGATSAGVSVTEPTGQVTLNRYTYSATVKPTDANGFPKPVGTVSTRFDSGHTLNVGPDSVAVFTTMAP